MSGIQLIFLFLGVKTLRGDQPAQPAHRLAELLTVRHREKLGAVDQNLV